MVKSLYKLTFLLFLFLILYIHDIKYLTLCLFGLWLLSIKEFWRLNRKVIKSILFFNLGVSIGYAILSFVKGINPLDYLLYINLKVYLLSYFVFWFFSRVDIVEFFSFSKDLSYLLMIALSQIISYKKSFEDFKLAYKARVVHKLTQRERGFITRVFEFFLKKSLHDSKERSLAMKSRGFFDRV